MQADTASLTAVAASTAVQRALTSCAFPHSSAYQMIPMRTLCSTSWLSTLGSTRRRAIKNPRSTAERAIQGIPKADTRSAPAARTSPSHHRAAAPASPYCAAMAAAPSSSPVPARRTSIPRACARPRASSSAISRVAATETPAVASVTKSA